MLAQAFIALAFLPAALSAQLLFGHPAVTEIPSTPLPVVAAGDVDGDGFADFVFGHAGAPGVMLGDGTGHFAEEIEMATDAVGSSVALADLDGDGLVDLLAGTSATHHFDVALNLGGGSFAPATTYNLGITTVGGNALVIETGDGDIDGDIDVLAVTIGGFGGPSGEARMFRNLGNGTLGMVGAVQPSFGFPRVIGGAVLSLNGDNRPDAVVAYDAGVQFPSFSIVAAVCNIDGSFSGTASWQDERLRGTGDVDGDGDLDLQLMHENPLFGPPNSLLSTKLNLGNGQFAAGPSFDLPLPNSFSVAGVEDLDGDGQADIALQEGFPPDLRVLAGHGDGSFATDGAHVSFSDIQGLTGGLLADFDGDGRDDFGALRIGGTLPPAIMISMNRTYPVGGPLLDLGHQLEGQQWPIQVAAGAFAGGTPFSFKLAGAPAGGSAFHVVGFSELNATFKGGTLVPLPFLITGPWPVNGQGQASIAGNWPNGPAGVSIYAQFWMADAAGPAGFAASSCVRVVTQ